VGDELSPEAEPDLGRLHRELLLPRVVEHKMLALLRRGQLSKWFSGIGQEAISVGVARGLRDDDWILPVHRNLGVFCSRDVDLAQLFRQLLGRDGGFTKGRDRSFHFGLLDRHIVGMISHLGAMLPVADGLALAAQLRGEDRVATALVGDGATSEGDVHEAMNLASVWRLPTIFVIENNQWGLSTPTDQQYACAELADRAVGYGMPGERVDGNDVLAVREAVAKAAAHARAGDGPVLLECMTYRMRGHEEASGTDYVPADELERWAEQDPLSRFEQYLDALPEGSAAFPDSQARELLRSELQAEVDRLVADALAMPLPSSDAATELADVTAPPSPLRRQDFGATGDDRSVRYLDAVTDGLRTALQADDRVVLLGQDIAEYGGVFKATAGLLEEFGSERVRNTPIVESAALGAALGLALDGFRPIVEMQFADFISCGFNQLVNNLATTHYRWAAPVPVVVRAPVGGGLGAGPFHSQNVEPYFASVPGLRIVAPATPADAKGLLLASLDDGNPVLFLEHKWLYRNVDGPVPQGHVTVPLGQGQVVRAGTGATVVTFGVGVHWCLAAAEALAVEPDAADVEVIDLRSLRPWDRALVLDSVRRTSRLLIVHEAPLSHGFAAEVAAVVADEAFEHLDAPVRRVGGLDTPIPFARELEAVWSGKDRVLPALRDLLAW
jgi:2-oxoisovalerate dehydrogenase E1 component